MFIGHYAVALAAKKAAPQTSLGTLVAAAIFLDLVWPFLVLASIETVAVDPSASAFTPLRFVSYPFSHSLLGSILWGAGFAAVYFLIRKYRSGALVLACLVVSHWLLDWITHVPDLPLTPWSAEHHGLGLWNTPSVTLAVELALFGTGLALYLRCTKAIDRTGHIALGAFVVLLLGFYAAAAFGPPPPNAQAVAMSALAQFLMVAFAVMVDRHRTIRS